MCAATTKASGLCLADVLRAGFTWFKGPWRFSKHQWKVFNAILACRTGKLGARLFRCDFCQRLLLVPLSCRNRHCPSCQGLAARDWLARQEQALLPVRYYHVVFTLPHTLNPLIRVNQKALYKALFDTTSKTLKEFARDELGVQLGITAVLHTWGQTLGEHYHLHCIVTGGGLSFDESRWVSPRGKKPYLFCVQALAEVFRGKYVARLKKLYAKGELRFHGESMALKQPSAFQRMTAMLYRKPWKVFSKPPFAGPKQVLAYLSRYTHRVAISDSRLLSLNDQTREVTFRYKDYGRGGKQKTTTIGVDKFIKRLSLHILPGGFVKTRHYGLLSAGNRKKKIARCRELLGPPTLDPEETTEAGPPPSHESEATKCPYCHRDGLRLIDVIYRPVMIPPERAPPTA